MLTTREELGTVTKFTIAADRVRPVQMYIEGKYRTIEVYVNGRATSFVW